MLDPCLNSEHLVYPRRDRYRDARKAVLEARGPLTFFAELEGMAFLTPEGTGIPEDTAHKGYVLVSLQTGQRYPLRIGLNTIGLFDDNDIVIRDRGISRRHCVILVHVRGGCELHDTESTNGTLVNGRRVGQPVALRAGDLLQVCMHLLRLEGMGDLDRRNYSQALYDTLQAQEYLATPQDPS